MNPEHYLTLNRDALAGLGDKERLDVLAELTRATPKWLADIRGDEIDALRNALGTDGAVAEHLGCSRAALSDLGDGPRVQMPSGQWAKPSLLQRTAEIIAEHSVTPNKRVYEAVRALSRKGRPSTDMIRAGAHRLTLATRNNREQDMDLPEAERRRVRRGLAHAHELAYQGSE